MQYDWILDVLTDLKTFAKSNGLPALAEQLDDTSLLAAAEIAQVAGDQTGGFLTNAEPAGAVHWGAATSDFT
jgi:hypothetical protein